jgi:elongation factor G
VKDFSVNDIRNVGLIGHQSVGKSTLAEALAFSTGVTNRLGSIDEGSTISDYRSDEIERKISISASLLQLTWKKNKFNVIDMPGYPDFIGEVRCGLKVSDLAVMVIGADSGPEVGTELAWDIVKEYNTPTLFFVNQEDKDHANFNKTLAALREAYGNDVSAIQFPVNEGVGFNSIIDLLQMKKISFKNDLSGQYTLEEIPSDLVEKANAMKNTLIEKIAESDDELLEKYFETEELDDQDILKGLRSGIVAGTLYPVLCVPQWATSERICFWISSLNTVLHRNPDQNWLRPTRMETRSKSRRTKTNRFVARFLKPFQNFMSVSCHSSESSPVH